MSEDLNVPSSVPLDAYGAPNESNLLEKSITLNQNTNASHDVSRDEIKEDLNDNNKTSISEHQPLLKESSEPILSNKAMV